MNSAYLHYFLTLNGFYTLKDDNSKEMCIRDSNIDWVTCSPKQGTKLEIAHMNEVKVVYEGQDITAYEQQMCIRDRLGVVHDVVNVGLGLRFGFFL